MRRRLAVWLLGSALLTTIVALVGCAVSTPVTPVTTTKHPAYAAGTACDAANCHTQYKHQKPYLGRCDTCHNTISWKQVTYKHKDPTFDNGMHPLVGCSTCHTEGQDLPTGGCARCHDAPHGGWTGCRACHTTVAWTLRKPLPKSHLSLAGGHSKLACTDCHSKAQEPATPRQCVNCHGTHHGGLRNCQDCHSPAGGWKPKAGFNHNDFFGLRGIHKTLQCAQCHKNGRFAGTPRVCVGCHGKQHGGLTDCGSCHTTSSFKPAKFKHSSVFSLTGQHAKLACSKCHPNRAFARTISNGGKQCTDCHGQQHGGLTECGSCHSTKGFLPPTFNHSSVFPRIGIHATLACSKCHPDNRFAIADGTHCSDCHGTHHGNQTQCQNCHTAGGGLQTTIKHPAASVPLGAKHAWPNPCSRCHPSNDFSKPTTPCQTCHTAPHVGPTSCTSCHQPTQWSDTHFVHPVIQNFDGTGPAGHTYTDFGAYPTGCAKCHPGTNGNPDFTGYSCTAAGCHQ